MELATCITSVAGFRVPACLSHHCCDRRNGKGWIVMNHADKPVPEAKGVKEVEK